MRFVTKNGWVPFHSHGLLSLKARRATYNFRCEDETRLYIADNEDFEGEVLAGIGVGDLEIEVVGYGPLYCRHVSEGRVWHRTDQISQKVLAHYGTSFTEVMDRPQVSEEVRAMQRMMRANQIARDRELETFKAELLRKLDNATNVERAEVLEDDQEPVGEGGELVSADEDEGRVLSDGRSAPESRKNKGRRKTPSGGQSGNGDEATADEGSEE